MVGPYLDQEIQEKKSTDSNIKHHDWSNSFQIGENWIDKEEYLFQLIDANSIPMFMVCVPYFIRIRRLL